MMRRRRKVHAEENGGVLMNGKSGKQRNDTRQSVSTDRSNNDALHNWTRFIRDFIEDMRRMRSV